MCNTELLNNSLQDEICTTWSILNKVILSGTETVLPFNENVTFTCLSVIKMHLWVKCLCAEWKVVEKHLQCLIIN